MVLRKMGNSVTPTIELSKEGDVYTFTTSSTFKTTVIKFKLGEEFEEETADGRKVKSVCTMNGDVMTQEQKGDKPTTIIREFSATEVITVSFICSTKLYIYIENFISLYLFSIYRLSLLEMLNVLEHTKYVKKKKLLSQHYNKKKTNKNSYVKQPNINYCCYYIKANNYSTQHRILLYVPQHSSSSHRFFFSFYT